MIVFMKFVKNLILSESKHILQRKDIYFFIDKLQLKSYLHSADVVIHWLSV